MEKVEIITGRAVPLGLSNVDTDQIIPAIWMQQISRFGYEDGLFEKWRKDPDFVLNQPEREGSTILVAGPNFGCGSSREHAPWALRDYGFKAVVAPSFADIFRNNLPNVGLVPVELDDSTCRELIRVVEADASAEVVVDVVNQTLSCEAAGLSQIPFALEPNAQYRLTNGLDLIDLALEHKPAITKHEANRPFWAPRSNGVVAPAFESSGI